MDSKKSTGYDGFPVKFQKVGADPLSMIILTLMHFPTTPEQEACVPFILQPKLAVSRLFC